MVGFLNYNSIGKFISFDTFQSQGTGTRRHVFYLVQACDRYDVRLLLVHIAARTMKKTVDQNCLQ